jgi:hypothetical protein
MGRENRKIGFVRNLGVFSEHHCRFKLLQFSPQIGALFSRMPIKLNFLGRN